jgi:hypothetical protein
MRRQLEDLATTVLQGDCVTQISKVTMHEDNTAGIC